MIQSRSHLPRPRRCATYRSRWRTKRGRRLASVLRRGAHRVSSPGDGADSGLRDAEFDADALGWAREGGHDAVVALLER
jgi:hypothetical protein